MPTIAQTADARSARLIDASVEVMGGWDNWHNTRCIAWSFFGRRMWHWDKWTGDVRCESDDGTFRVAMNIHDKQGKVFLNGETLTNPDSLAKYLNRGYEMWVNDSYWLIMPFKLRDPGTNCRYIGPQKTLEGEVAEVIELTFADVGVTPENKYHIYFNKETNLVCQWDYYAHFEDEEPSIQNPWTDFKQYGSILLSTGRGRGSLGDVGVFEQCDPELFQRVDKTLKHDQN